MAVSRDQAARVLRQEAVEEHADGNDALENSAPLAEQLRAHVVEEAKRRTGEAPEKPMTDKPVAPAT
jgi:membrane fusion protein (multidrug efflux system)